MVVAMYFQNTTRRGSEHVDLSGELPSSRAGRVNECLFNMFDASIPRNQLFTYGANCDFPCRKLFRVQPDTSVVLWAQKSGRAFDFYPTAWV